MRRKKYKAENARRFKRLKADYLIKYQPSHAEGDPSISNIKDISANGLRFLTENFFPEGTALVVSVHIPPIDRTLTTTARVVRVRSAGSEGLYYMSVRYVDLFAEDQALLDDFIERLAKDRQASFMVDHAQNVKRQQEFEPIRL